MATEPAPGGAEKFAAVVRRILDAYVEPRVPTSWADGAGVYEPAPRLCPCGRHPEDVQVIEPMGLRVYVCPHVARPTFLRELDPWSYLRGPGRPTQDLRGKRCDTVPYPQRCRGCPDCRGIRGSQVL